MKHAIALLLITSSFFSFSQPPTHLVSQEYSGSIKSAFTYNYAYDKSDTLADQKSLHPACEVCDHFKKFNEKGQLIESQEYVILEPVSDLEMGYCLNMVFRYDNDELILITSKKFEEHGMSFWGDTFANGEEETMYSISKNGDSTTTKYVDTWGSTDIKYYKNGLLVQDSDRMYYYDDKNQKIKTSSMKDGVLTDEKTETWTYANGLVSTFTSIRSGSYYSAYETRYTYFDSGKLHSEKKYKLKDPEKDEETLLQSAKYYYEDGRDSSQQYNDFYTRKKSKNDFNFEYEFHPNGTVSTKTKKNGFGQVCDFESYDDRGNLTQKKLYNIYFEVYNIDTYTCNEKNQLTEKHVENKHRKKEYTLTYKYDKHGNQTHEYRKSDGAFFLVQQKVYEYYN